PAKCDHTQLFGGMCCTGIDQVFDVPHSPREFPFGKDPATSKATQTVRFGQTTRAYEWLSLADSRGSLDVHTIQIGFVHKYARPGTLRNFTEIFQVGFK